MVYSLLLVDFPVSLDPNVENYAIFLRYSDSYLDYDFNVFFKSFLESSSYLSIYV